jgi:ribonuclease P protein component
LRLHKTDEFSSVFAFRRCCAGAGSPALLPEQPRHARLGLVVAKKLAKRAVQRNLVKRIGATCSVMPGKPAHDLVLRLSAKLDNVTRRMMREDMNSLLGRLPKK